MKQNLLDLYSIQKIDLKIREMELEYEAIPQELNQLEFRIKEKEVELQDLIIQREEIINTIKSSESNIDEENIKLKKWERRLNDIANQREYLALSREIKLSKYANNELEEKTLLLLEEKENLDNQVNVIEENLLKWNDEYETNSVKVEKEVGDLNKDILRTTASRESILSKIPKNLLKKYDLIRKKRIGLGLSAAFEGICTACNMRLPPQLYNILMRINSIEQCPSCQRILYYSVILDEENKDIEN